MKTSLLLVTCFFTGCSVFTHVDPVTGKTVKGMDPAEKAKITAEAQKAAKIAFQATVNAVVNSVTTYFGTPVDNSK